MRFRIQRNSHLRSTKQTGNFIIFSKLQFLVNNSRLVYLPTSERFTTKVYLGSFENQDYFCTVVPDQQPYLNFGNFVDARPHLFNLSEFDQALLRQALPMIDFHSRYLFCANCSAPTVSVMGGYKKECSNPNCTSHTKVENYSYPRVDPVVITLVEHPTEQSILLGRNKNWPAGRYSLVAGFMEPGETVEEAAIREVYEETGIECDSDKVTYVTSQAWPFPSQLMLGCKTKSNSTQIRLIDDELEDAKWFTRQEVLDGFQAKGITLPPDYAIAHTLIQQWLKE